jgi:hypothetical protein
MEWMSPSPSSGDCEVAAEPAFRQRDGEFGTGDGSTRFENEDTIWHRGRQLHSECEWKHGESAMGRRRAAAFRAPPVGRRSAVGCGTSDSVNRGRAPGARGIKNSGRCPEPRQGGWCPPETPRPVFPPARCSRTVLGPFRRLSWEQETSAVSGSTHGGAGMTQGARGAGKRKTPPWSEAASGLPLVGHVLLIQVVTCKNQLTRAAFSWKPRPSGSGVRKFADSTLD